MGLMSRPGLVVQVVATWFEAWQGKRGRDLVLRSRPGSACLRLQPGLEVAT